MTEKQGQNKDFRDNQWKPGQSGNPAGRPPNKKYLSEWAAELLEQIPVGEVGGRNADQLVTMALIREALKGNTKAIDMLHDWTEGKVPDTHRIEGDIPVTLVYEEAKKDGQERAGTRADEKDEEA